MTDEPDLPDFKIDLSDFELNFSDSSGINNNNFYLVTKIETSKCDACGQAIPNFETEELKQDKKAQKEGHIYLFTITHKQELKIVYVGLTSRTLSARMKNYNQGRTGWGNNYRCIHEITLAETGAPEPSYTHQDPSDYFKKIQKKLKGQEILGGSQTTNKRVAYLFSRVLADPDYTGRIWTFPFPQVENLLIEHLQGQKFPLLNEK